MEEMEGADARMPKPEKQYRSRRRTAPKVFVLKRNLASGLRGKSQGNESRSQQNVNNQSTELFQAAVIVAILVIAAVLSRNLRNMKKHTEYAMPSFVKEDYISLDQYTRPGILNPGTSQVVFIPSQESGQTAEAIRSGFLKAGSDGEYNSSHFAVGDDGSVLYCIPLEEVACGRYAGNLYSISVTYSRASSSDGILSDDEYKSMVELGRWLIEKYGLTNEALVSSEESILMPLGLDYEADGSFWAKYRAEVGK